MKTERVPVQPSRSLLVAAVAGGKAAQLELPKVLRVTSRNHFACTVCGRTLMTGESAHRDTLDGHEAEVVCELCQRQRQRAGSTGKS